MRSILRHAGHWLHFFFDSGSWRLRPLESLVVDAVIGQIPASHADRLRKQLQQPYFVERTNSRINVIRLDRPEEHLKIPGLDFTDKLYKVSLAVDGANEIAHVTFYKGFIFSVEFKKPRHFYANKRVEVRSVAVGSPKQTYTREIDQAEHGDDV